MFLSFPFIGPTRLQQATADTDMCDITFAVSYSLSFSPHLLSPSLSLRISSNPAVYRSLSPYHTKPGKAHTHAGLGKW